MCGKENERDFLVPYSLKKMEIFLPSVYTFHKFHVVIILSPFFQPLIYCPLREKFEVSFLTLRKQKMFNLW